jgi:heme exporter protein CcmD
MSWPALPPMGGYEFYVWASYALTLTAMGGEVLLLLWRQREWRDDVKATTPKRRVKT